MTQPAPASGPNWSLHFLKLMAGIIFLSPLVGALLYLLGAGFTSSDQEPLDTAIAGAKLGLLIGGFASPIVALGLTARKILKHHAKIDGDSRD